MQEYQQRVVEESDALYEKLTKLTAFLGTSVYLDLPIAEQKRLKRQQSHMKAYFDVLGERIAAFPPAEGEKS